jgi:acyl carrier protein
VLNNLLPVLASTTITAWRKDWETLSPTQCRDRVLQQLQQEVSEVIGRDISRCSDPQVGFFELGMDSLMSLELKNRLQARFELQLSSTLTFDHPTFLALTNYLFAQLLPSKSTSIDQPIESSLQAIQQLSETELTALIEQEFITWVTGATS